MRPIEKYVEAMENKDFAGLSLSAGGGHQRYSGQPHQVLPARKFEIKTAKHRKKFTIGG